MKRSLDFPDITNPDEWFKVFLTIYFGGNYDMRLFEKWEALIFEITLYLDDGQVGGWSGFYCQMTWNKMTLKSEADLKIFDLLLKIDIQNEFDTSKIVYSLCNDGAFEVVKVRFRQNYRLFEIFI